VQQNVTTVVNDTAYITHVQQKDKLVTFATSRTTLHKYVEPN
jgi:hypothetical protein